MEEKTGDSSSPKTPVKSEMEEEKNSSESSRTKSPVSNERMRRKLETAEPIPKTELPPNLCPTSRFYHGTLLNLPIGWLIEQRPRTTDKYLGKADQFFYEPGTAKQSRSLKAVWRHLEMDGDNFLNDVTSSTDESPPTPTTNQNVETSSAEQESKVKNKKKIKKKQRDITFDSTNPPESITWCLIDAENNKWIPEVSNSIDAEALRDDWAHIFHSILFAANPTHHPN